MSHARCFCPTPSSRGAVGPKDPGEAGPFGCREREPGSGPSAPVLSFFDLCRRSPPHRPQRRARQRQTPCGLGDGRRWVSRPAAPWCVRRTSEGSPPPCACSRSWECYSGAWPRPWRYHTRGVDLVAMPKYDPTTTPEEPPMPEKPLMTPTCSSCGEEPASLLCDCGRLCAACWAEHRSVSRCPAFSELAS